MEALCPSVLKFCVDSIDQNDIGSPVVKNDSLVRKITDSRNIRKVKRFGKFSSRQSHVGVEQIRDFNVKLKNRKAAYTSVNTAY